jgi:HK97 family phage major capsid protein
MKKSDQLKQLRAQKIEAQKAIHTTAEAEKRSLNEAETTQFRALQAEITDLNGQIDDVVAYETNLRSLEGKSEMPKKEGEEGKEGKQKRAFSLNTAIRAMISGDALTGPELEAHERATKIAKDSGIGLSVRGFALPVESRADGQTVTGDSGGYGATAVATDKGAPIDYLRPKTVVEKLGAVFLTGLVGNLSFPKNNGGVTAAWKGEVETVDPTKDAWGEVEMTPKRLTVRVPISLQNLMQSSFDMEMYTMNTIRKEIENKLDKAALVGSGTGEPTGVLNTSGIGSVAIGTNGGAPTYAAIVGLETAISTNNADVDGMSYVSNSKVKGALKTTPKVSGQPVYIMNEDGSLNGYPYFNSNHIPSNLTKGTASGVCSAAIFGDFSKLVIGQWGFMDITVDDKSRKKDGYIDLIVNLFADVAVLEPKAFAAVKDLTTT